MTSDHHAYEVLTQNRPAHWPEPIDSVESLHDHLHTAMMLEHATIPAYLTAMYSLKSPDDSDAALVIRSVVIEEMLHLTLAGNVLNAVGGHAKLTDPRFIPKYPTRLPHSANRFEVSTARFCPETVKTFMEIEHPADGADPVPQPEQYDTIGQFYLAIKQGIDHLLGRMDMEELFCGEKSWQIRPEDYYGSGGGIIEVKDRDSAFAAIDEIIEQGEGAWERHPVTGKDHRNIWEDPEGDIESVHDQAAHYFRFDEILRGRYYDPGDQAGYPTGERLRFDWDDVWPIRANTRASDFPESSEIRERLDGFNRSYMRFLDVLQEAFTGNRGRIRDSVPMMYDLKYQAQAIARIPIPGSDEHVGPSWEWVPDWLR